MERVLQRINYKAALAFLVVTMAIGISYFVAAWSTPAWSFPAMGLSGFRLANAIRGLTLLIPAAPFGLALGGMMANMADGRFFLGGFSILTLGQLTFGLITYYLAKRTKSPIMHIGLLVAFGVGMGLLQVVNLTLILHVKGVVWNVLLINKTFSEVFSTVIGYPLFLIFKAGKH